MQKQYFHILVLCLVSLLCSGYTTDFDSDFCKQIMIRQDSYKVIVSPSSDLELTKFAELEMLKRSALAISNGKFVETASSDTKAELQQKDETVAVVLITEEDINEVMQIQVSNGYQRNLPITLTGTGKKYIVHSAREVMEEDFDRLLGEDVVLVLNRTRSNLSKITLESVDTMVPSSFLMWFQDKYGFKLSSDILNMNLKSAVEKFNLMIPTAEDLVAMIDWAITKNTLQDMTYSESTGREVSMRIRHDGGSTHISFDESLGERVKDGEEILNFVLSTLNLARQDIDALVHSDNWQKLTENQSLERLQNIFKNRFEGYLQIEFKERTHTNF